LRLLLNANFSGYSPAMKSQFITVLFLLSLFVVTEMARADDRLVVGVSLPLSGANASFGEATRRGFEMAQRADLDSFKKIDLRFSDNGYDATKSISSFNELTSVDRAEIVFMWGSAPCLATAPLAEKRKLPLVCFAGDKKAEFKYVYGFVSPSRDYAKPLVEVIEAKQLSRTALVYTEIPFLTSLTEALQAQLSKETVKNSTGFTPGVQDFRSFMLKLKTLNIDSIALFLLPDQIAPFIQQMRQQGLDPFIIGTDTLTDPTVLGRSANLVQGAVFSDIDIPDALLKTYVQEYGSSHNASFAANSYYFARMIAKIINAPGFDPNKDLQRSLRSIISESACNSCSYIYDPEYGQYFASPVIAKSVRGSSWERYKMPSVMQAETTK